MKEAALVAIAAAIGNFLQGWDNACIAGTFLLLITYFLPVRGGGKYSVPIPFFEV